MHLYTANYTLYTCTQAVLHLARQAEEPRTVEPNHNDNILMIIVVVIVVVTEI